ncbi:RagB/SusD family nutrient uptake outer membrane protein [Capnocytophaga sp.]|uniref:RagB/SusD family nutrient uptake outer membrane protein n=1 Tax=Capnocytophaga sp. TaxID=44737 RepID=UPI0026DB981F|nr:RagB/SusD family nutrient uptake outer membrane protein [Capnocytophaga sp.]MDO5105232.1 RagB/SusD family nutrient uptake outer membrane protein [Capnocytophaga sp.]
MKKYLRHITIVSGVLLLASCNDFLDREPLDKITPEIYFNNEGDLAAFTIGLYPDADFLTIAPGAYGLSVFKSDNDTDNQASPTGNARWLPGEWRVQNSNKEWKFETIRRCNYFFENVLPKYEAGEIDGNQTNIKRYIGEMYVLRANIYFAKLQAYGDFPIITKVLPENDKEALTESSKRRPRNEVARFILSDLDRAISLLSELTPNGKNRLNIDAAYLLKSRVALYEGTWLKYHKGTAQVPGGNGWPGANADYLQGFSINIDEEIKFFLQQAKEAAQVVAAKMVTGLAHNSGERVARNKSLVSRNEYYMMFADDNMEIYKEVIFWRKFSKTEQQHNIQFELAKSGGGSGYTKGFVESFLMKNGLPIYAAGSGYAGDEYLKDVLKNRDDRLRLFTKIDKDTTYYHDGQPVLAAVPQILNPNETRSTTGYRIKKGMNFSEADLLAHHVGTSGSLVFRGAEALLNYIEADYELNGSLDGNSETYWKALRARAKVDTDFNKTIAATDMEREKLGDLGAYSAGNLVNTTLYNIRRERRSEFIAEGLRWMDLKRWRSMDQIKNNPYIVEGFKIWGPMKDWYKKADGTSALVVSDADNGNVNPQANSVYLRPYQRNKKNNLYYDGYKWNDAHYLSPIPMDAFRLTTKTEGDLNSSVIYQNPGWSKISGESLK